MRAQLPCPEIGAHVVKPETMALPIPAGIHIIVPFNKGTIRSNNAFLAFHSVAGSMPIERKATIFCVKPLARTNLTSLAESLSAARERLVYR